MNSRMERYNEDDSVISETRTSKNKNLYDTISNGDFSRVQTNSNFKVIETGGNNIDMEKIKKYITSMNQKPAPKREKLFTEINITPFSLNKFFAIDSLLLINESHFECL